MKVENIIHENVSHCGCDEWMLQRKQMSIFVKMINHHHDDYIFVGFR
jgi:hypothetical protein